MSLRHRPDQPSPKRRFGDAPTRRDDRPQPGILRCRWGGLCVWLSMSGGSAAGLFGRVASARQLGASSEGRWRGRRCAGRRWWRTSRLSSTGSARSLTVAPHGRGGRGRRPRRGSAFGDVSVSPSDRGPHALRGAKSHGSKVAREAHSCCRQGRSAPWWDPAARRAVRHGRPLCAPSNRSLAAVGSATRLSW